MLKQNLKYFSALISSTILLTACGGSGSSTIEPSLPPVITPPPTFTLSVNTSYMNKCGIVTAHPDTEVFVHDNDWNVIARKVANMDGATHFVFEDDTPRPITVVSYLGSRDESEAPIQIQSFSAAPIQNITISSDYIPANNASCDCMAGTIEFSFPTDGNIQLISGHRSEEIVLISGNNYAIEACKVDSSWRPIYVRFRDFENNLDFASIIRNFDALEDGQSMTASIDFEGTSIQVSDKFESYTVAMKYSNINAIIDSTQADGNLLIFSEILSGENALFNVSGTNYSRFASNKSAQYSRQKFTQQISDIYLLESMTLPTLQDIESLSFDENLSYDFSKFTTMPLVTFRLGISAPKNKTFFVSHLSSTTSSLPPLTAYAEYSDQLSDIIEISALLRFEDYGEDARTVEKYLQSIESTGPITVDNFNHHIFNDFEHLNIQVIDVFN